VIAPVLPGKGIFVFSDPGGARGILSYIHLAKVNSPVIMSDRAYAFFQDYQLDVQSYQSGDEIRMISGLQPDFIFTGTSYTSDIEKCFLHAAKNAGIKTVSFIDHYTSFETRFRFNGEMLSPDIICVLDDEARKTADQLFTQSEILITGNYYHQYLSQWHSPVQREELLRQLNIESHKKLIVLAPDPLTNVGGIDKWGTDELVFCQEVYEMLGKTNEYVFLLKQHPNQNQEILKDFINSTNGAVRVADHIHPNVLLYNADLVAGIFSSILAEAEILGTPVIRYLGGLTQPDPLQHRSLGNVIKNKFELPAIVTKTLSHG